ncbi:unnamed protein product [Cunninghamella echinulata]
MTRILVLLLFISVCLGTTWNHKFLDDWDNGWDSNGYGEAIDSEAACDERPCVRYKLIKPLHGIHKEYCGESRNDGVFDCNYLPKDAILVNNIDEFF